MGQIAPNKNSYVHKTIGNVISSPSAEQHVFYFPLNGSTMPEHHCVFMC